MYVRQEMQVPNRRLMMRFAFSFLFFVVILAIRSPLRAQSFYGSVTGTVTDASGAVVPNATVTVTNNGTGQVQTVKSDQSGNFSVVNLVPADYTVEVSKTGFKRFLSDHLGVQVGASDRVDARLDVGAATEEVVVTTGAPLLQTETTSLSQEVTSQEVAQLPLNGRNVMNLIALGPGVEATGGANGGAGLDQGNRTAGGVGWGNYQIGGAIQGQSAYYIDGVPNNLLGGNIMALVPTQDTVQEFTVATSNATADFGRFAGGVVNMTTKSGSNAFHGSVWEYFRNADLNANDYFSNLQGSPRPQWNQNQYGAMVSGPIKKDKLFFMFSWEGFKALTSSVNTTLVPTTAASRAKNGGSDLQDGIFPNAIVDPLGNCNISTTANPGFWTITNLYQGACGDPLNRILKTYYPDPNASNPSYNWFSTSPLTNSQNQYNGRIDYVISPKQRFFGRYTYWALADNGHSTFAQKGLNGTTWPTNDGSVTDYTHQAVLGDTYTITPTSILDVRLDFVRLTNINPPDNTSVDESQFGSAYAALSPQMSLHEIPAYQLAGNHNLYDFSHFTNYNANWYDTYGINANLIKIAGHHSLKFGGEIRLMDVTGTNYIGQASGEYNYNTSFTGDEFASFLMGYPSQINFGEYRPSASYTYYQAYYAMDTWQATHNLTLTLGLRYELPGGVSERNNRTTVLLPNAVDPYTGITGTESLVASSLYPGRSVVVPEHNLFAPRVGVSYRAGANTVIHGGYGISYLPNDVAGPNGLGTMSYSSVVNLSSTQVNIPNSGNPVPLQTSLSCLAGSATGANCTSIGIAKPGINQPIGRSVPNFMTLYGSKTNYLGQTIVAPVPYQPYPYTQQWNVSASRQFKGDMMVEAAYSGLKGTNLPGIGNQNLSAHGLDELSSQYYSLGAGLTAVHPCANANGLMLTVGQCDRPFPYYNDVQDSAAYDSTENYRAFMVRGEKRFGSAGTLMGNYTWSKNMSNTDTQNSWLEQKATQQGGVGMGGIQDFNNLQNEYSLLSYDVTNKTIVGYVLPLPFGKGQRFGNRLSGFADTLASGWAVDGITTFRSGFPVFISTAGNNLLTSSFGAGTLRPNVVPGCNPKIGGSGLARAKTGEWFNVKCFVFPTSSSDPNGLVTFGNEPRVDPSVRADGIKNFDFSLQKSTSIFEKANLQFRAEFFNVFNRVQFAGPSSVAPLTASTPTIDPSNDSGFGSVGYQINHPRQIQLSLRVNY